MRLLAQGHTSSKQQSQDLYPGQPGSKVHAPFYPTTGQWHLLHLSYSQRLGQMTDFFKESVLWGGQSDLDLVSKDTNPSSWRALLHYLQTVSPDRPPPSDSHFVGFWSQGLVVALGRHLGSRCTFLAYKIQIVMLFSLGCCGGPNKMMTRNVFCILVSAVHFLIVYWRALHSVGAL